MAFKVSNKAFEQAFNTKSQELKTIKSPQDIVDDFLKGLTAYLKHQSRYPAAKAISSWMSKGGSLSSFTCRADMVEPMVSALRRENIPFIIVQEVTGDKGFLIRSKDNELQRKIARYLLKTSSQYCRVTSGKEAGQEYLHRRIPDKNMIAIGDITKEQLVYLEELCNGILPGEVIGVDKMEDGTYLVTVHGETAILGANHGQSKLTSRNFAAALSETIFVFNANVRRDVAKDSQDTRAFRMSKANGFLDANGSTQQPVWIVGRENRFVKRTVRGFELGHAEEVGDEVLLESDMRVSFDDTRYDVRLNSALSKISGKKVLYRLADVIDHFKTKKKQEKNSKLAGEKHLMEEVDRVVSNKVRRDAIYVRGNDWGAKLRHYQAEASKVLQAAKEGRIPQGYRKEHIMELMDIAHRYKLDLNLAAPAIDKLKSLEIFDRPAGPPRVRSIEQEIARFSQDRSVQPPTIERPAIGRDDGRG